MGRRFDNPFTPSFGGMPERFFGRSDISARVLRAFDNVSSPDRVLFFTGPRGCGKTALLEHLSRLARKARWMACDVHSSNACDALRDFLRPGLTAKSGSLALPGGVTVSAEARAASDGSPANLTAALLQKAGSLSAHKGIFITVDEIQKIAEPEMEEICAAVQMARRKGLPVMLMMAGLPGSKKLVAGYRGCTFMQRVEDVHLGALRIDETHDAFRESCAQVRDLSVSDEVIGACAALSQGYPYLVQLVGYEFLESVREAYPVGVMAPTVDDVAAIEEEVYETYRSNVIVPSTKALGKEGKAYLRAMSSLLDEQGFAKTADVAHALGKEQKQLSSCRQGLLDRRLILSGGYGKVCYGLPYLQRYSREQPLPLTTDFTNRWVPR